LVYITSYLDIFRHFYSTHCFDAVLLEMAYWPSISIEPAGSAVASVGTEGTRSNTCPKMGFFAAARQVSLPKYISKDQHRYLS
jgi:hypothetical protein